MAKKSAPPAPEPSTEIATFAPALPAIVFQSPEQLESLLGQIRNLVNTFEPDLTTSKGREAIKSLAYKVTRTKTTLDNAGKELNAGKRAEIDVVDAERRRIWDELETLAAQARKPLDDWEAAEAARVALIKTSIQKIDEAAAMLADCTSDDIAERIVELEALEFDADEFQEWLAIAIAAKTKALSILKQAQMRAMRAEEDAAELARLRDAERVRIAEQAEVTAYARAREEAETENARRDNAAAEAERKRLADKAEAERREAERLAEAASIAGAHERAEAQKIIDAAEAETERLREAERKRLADIATAEAEQAARDADRAHRGKIMKAAKEAIMTHGVAEPEARAIVLAIVADEIPSVKLTF